jgi:predicted flap endonuclease-1-like 5' DNA nuclease
MFDPALVGVAVAGVSVVTAAAYAYATGNATSVGVDVDDDGDDEVTFEADSEGGYGMELEGANGVQPAVGVDVGAESDDSSVNEDVESQADPTPSEVTEKDSLEDVTGVGPTRATALQDAGYDTPADLYYASDENLEAVHGIGPRAVSNIRKDIGGVGEGN